jgi:ribosomal-protein-alanine N-acetyltransferase
MSQLLSSAQLSSVLVSERLVLEPLTESHAARLFDALSDAALYRYVPNDPPSSVETLAARYRALSLRRSPDGQEIWLNWAARLRFAADYVGTFEATVYGNNSAHLAYNVFSPQWRQGFGKEGAGCVVRHLVGDLHITYVMADIDMRNRASQGLVESLGFRRGPVRKGADFYKGSLSDEVRYVLDLRDQAVPAPDGGSPPRNTRSEET